MMLQLFLWVMGGALIQEPVAPTQAAGPTTRPGAHQYERLRYSDRLDKDGTLLRIVDVQVKLNTAQGVAEFGQIGHAYLVGYGEVQFEEVAIEKADGRRIAVTNGLVEDVNPFGVTATSLPADLHYKRLTIPGLEAGDRLSYGTSARQKPLSPRIVFGETQLWPTAGSLVQVYELDVPRDMALTVRLRKDLGADWEVVPSSSDRLVRRLSLAVPPPDPAATLTKEARERLAEPEVMFTSFRSWNEVASWWWNLSKDRFAAEGDVAKEAARLSAGAATPAEKLAALWRFTSNIRYLNVSFGLGRMQPRKASEVLANRYGDCKDKHALLAALASSLNIDVRPVLINSERPNLREDAPSPGQFDHVVSVVRLGKSPEEWLWFDGTNPFGGPGYLMPQLRDKRAMLVESDGTASIVHTPKDPPLVARQEVTLKGTLNEEGLLKSRFSFVFQSDLGVILRMGSALVSPEQFDKFVKAQVGDRLKGLASLANASTSDPFDFSTPFRLEFDVESTIPAKGGERSLRGLSFSQELPATTDEPAPGDDAVRFPYREVVERTEIEIPEGEKCPGPLLGHPRAPLRDLSFELLRRGPYGEGRA